MSGISSASRVRGGRVDVTVQVQDQRGQGCGCLLGGRVATADRQEGYSQTPTTFQIFSDEISLEHLRRKYEYSEFAKATNGDTSTRERTETKRASFIHDIQACLPSHLRVRPAEDQLLSITLLNTRILAIVNVLMQRGKQSNLVFGQLREFLSIAIPSMFKFSRQTTAPRTSRFPICRSEFALFGTALVPLATCHARLI